SNELSPDFAAPRPSFSPAPKYSGVGFGVQPRAQPSGQRDRRNHLLVPVSNAVTGAVSAFGAPSFKYCARNGARISSRKYGPVALLNFNAPSELASSISWP